MKNITQPYPPARGPMSGPELETLEALLVYFRHRALLHARRPRCCLAAALGQALLDTLNYAAERKNES